MARKKNQNYSLRTPQLNLKRDTRRGVIVVALVVLAIVCTLSLVNLAGSFGELLSNVFKLAFGWAAYVVPLIFVFVAVALFRQTPEEDEESSVSTHAYVGAVLLTLSITGVMHLWVLREDVNQAFDLVKLGSGGGYLGVLTSYPLMHFMGFVAGMVILIAAIIISLLVTFNVSFSDLFKRSEEDEEEEESPKKQAGKLKINNASEVGFVKESISEPNRAVLREKPQLKVNNLDDVMPSNKQALVSTTDKDWKFPSLDLLEDAKTKVDSGNIEVNVAIVQKTLNDFGVEVEMGEVNVGPTVTQYTFRPAVGVKLSQIAALQNDLALALSASSIRMELPIPGKALVGIEIPNKTTAMVRVKEILGSPAFIEHESKLAFSLGRDVSGHPIVADLAKMPHLLIAGATGSGKSVAVNSFIISLLYRGSPSEVKFILVDPKRVELNLYNGLPHLLTGVITDHQKAVNALKWAVAEMDRRYKLLSEVHKRNISEYNSSAPNRLPYIVVVVDELADLMSVAQNEVEATIVRLAQMARAVGIHLVLATQRPSVDVITGLIKANITARMAFAVASQVDSRTILDSSGAEKLLGSGDMLYITSELPKPKRVQGAFVAEKEIRKVVEFIKEQTGAVLYDDNIVEKPQRGVSIPGLSDGSDDEDDLLGEAMEIVQAAGKASASLLQRRLRVGYARAARLLDILEDKGIIGPGDGAKPREVYGAGGTPAETEEGYGELDTTAQDFDAAQKDDYK